MNKCQYNTANINENIYILYDILHFIYTESRNKGAFSCVTTQEILNKFNNYNLNYKKISAIMSILADRGGVSTVHKKINNVMVKSGWNIGWNYSYMKHWQDIIERAVKNDKNIYYNF